MIYAWAIATALGTACASSVAQDPSIDTTGGIRIRYETAESASAARQSDALTMRTSVGATWEPARRWSLSAEVETVTLLTGRYDDGEGPPEARPVIPDPEFVGLNQLHVDLRPTDGSSVRVGRQLISHADERFVGSIGFRQNDQSFDAARLEMQIGSAFADISYVGAIQRPLGLRGGDERLEGDAVLAKIDFPTPIGTVSGFSYHLDFADGRGNPALQGSRSHIHGLRIAGQRGPSALSASWELAAARQHDIPTGSESTYHQAQFALKRHGASVDIRFEELGDGVAPFATPLGTNRAFQGHADVFLATPTEGIRDRSVGVRTAARDVGVFKRVRLAGRYHVFDPAGAGQRYGDELDFIASATLLNARVSLERAAYHADGFDGDVTRWWATFSRSF